MSDLDDRIAILRNNIRDLTEQAAAASGIAAEERIAQLIADQTAELEKLVKKQEARPAS